MTNLHSTAIKKETAVLVAVTQGKQRDDQTQEYLHELAFLAETLGVETLRFFTQKLERADMRTFVGKGKLADINAYVIDKAVSMVIFDDDLSPSQMRNLENELKVKIYDRSLLILDIFLQRAQTAQAKIQVELARSQYMLPRLTRMWTHLERQRGGTGTRGGSGEMEIETDKRVIKDKINLLKEKLDKIEKQSAVRRKSREGVSRVALVGYTNVGKSTLMQLLSKSDVFAENKLFATVDSTVRKVNFGDIPFLLSDTVGFIRKLPTHLIESFKSTLDEIREADVLIHVVDISHPSFENQIEVVKTTLSSIGVEGKPVILVFNKIDQIKDEEPDVLHEDGLTAEQKLAQLKLTYMGKGDEISVFISAVNKQNIEELKKALYDQVLKVHMRIFPNYLKNETY